MRIISTSFIGAIFRKTARKTWEGRRRKSSRKTLEKGLGGEVDPRNALLLARIRAAHDMFYYQIPAGLQLRYETEVR